MGLWNQFSAIMLRQRGHLFGWVPVCLALGIGWYFSLTAEPSVALLWATALAAAALAVVARALPEVTAPFAQRRIERDLQLAIQGKAASEVAQELGVSK